MAVGSIFDVEKKSKHLGEKSWEGRGKAKLGWSILTPTGR
jgi:hypothetical protein